MVVSAVSRHTWHFPWFSELVRGVTYSCTGSVADISVGLPAHRAFQTCYHVPSYWQVDQCQDKPFVINRTVCRNEVTNFLLLYIAVPCDRPVLDFFVSVPSRKWVPGNQRLHEEHTGSVASLYFLKDLFYSRSITTFYNSVTTDILPSLQNLALFL